jgi:hypothetical protein
MSSTQQKTTRDTCRSIGGERVTPCVRAGDATATGHGDQTVQTAELASMHESTVIVLPGKQETAPEATRQL